MQHSTSLYSQWLILRLLFEHGYFATLFPAGSTPHHTLLSAFGIDAETVQPEDAHPHIREQLNRRYAELSAQNGMAEPEGWAQAYANLTILKNRLNLNDCEAALLRFALHMATEEALRQTLTYIRSDFRRVVTLLASLLGYDKSAIHQALKKEHKLKGYGILQQRDFHLETFDDFISWNDVLDADELCIAPLSERSLLRHCLFPADAPGLAWHDFDHIAAMRDIITAHLTHAYAHGKSGANILLYGAPGTGKSEFSALLAARLDVPCYMLSFEDRDGDALEGYQRLNHCRLAQAVLSGDRALLVFDEAEDVFSGTLAEKSAAQRSKGWVNRFLENNPVPMLWITNNVACMDEAFIRRFDLVLEMPDLPVAQKTALIRKHGKHLQEHEIRHFAQQENLPPALLARTLQVLSPLDDPESGTHAERIFNQTLRAQGKRKIAPLPTAQAPYSLEWIHCDHDLAVIENGLKDRPHARICCYGIPGTGKTAWVHHLAEQLGKPLLLRHSADLLDSYVGETEKRIAQAFAQAQEEERLLLLDEVDSFLFTRDNAAHSWERTMVNEMLTQIEHYQGLLIVSTNALHSLDSAALRRFDLKLHFKPLTDTHITALARAQAQHLGLPEPDTDSLKRLLRLKNLTPGDFAAVARRHRFAPFANSAAWLQALIDECRFKPAGGERIGF